MHSAYIAIAYRMMIARFASRILMSFRPPYIPPESLATIVKRHFPFESVKVESVKQFDGYDDRNYYFVGDLNEDVASTINGDCKQFVIKLINSRDSKNIDVLEGLSKLTQFLHERNFKCPYPIPTSSADSGTVVLRLSDLLPYTNGVIEDISNGSDNDPRYCVRVFVFVEGELFGHKPQSPELLYELGCHIGRMNNEMMQFSHSCLESRQFIEWDLKHLLTKREILPIAIRDPEKNRIVTKVLGEFEKHVIPIMKNLESGVIHNDLNGLNVITRMDSCNKLAISGIIDFSDCVFAPYVFEIGTSMVYLMSSSDDPVRYIKPLLQGYLSKFKLSKESLNVLYYAILGRAALSYINSAYNFQLEPTNEYILVDAEPMWKLINILLDEGKETCYRHWEIVN